MNESVYQPICAPERFSDIANMFGAVSFCNCGPFGYIAAFLGIAGFFLLLIMTTTRRMALSRYYVLAAALSALPVLVGFFGESRGRAMTESGLIHADETQRAILLAAGYAEAAHCVSIGLRFMFLPLLAAVIGSRIIAKRPTTPSRNDPRLFE